MQLKTYTSSVLDRTMRSIDGDYEAARKNRAAFIAKSGLDPNSASLHTLSYDGDDYCRYVLLDDDKKGDGVIRDSTIVADAVVVTEPNHAVLLPLADCIGAVIHDPTKNILMVSHLGRHNLEQFGGTKCVEYLIDKHGVDPARLIVWLSPSASKENYPLYAFGNRSLQDVAIEQLVTAGVSVQNISASQIDSAADQNYFSHSQFLKGNRDTDGRFAIVAALSPGR